MRCAYSSNVGMRRQINQDSYVAANFEKDGRVCYLFAVADGLGGHPHGEVASRLATEYIKQNISMVHDLKDYGDINDFVNDINRRIINEGIALGDAKGMATTLTMCVVDDQELSISHVGDSRAYRITQNGIERLTKDHSLVQKLVDEGKLDSAMARLHPHKNVITRALGTDSVVRTDFFEYTMDPGDLFLVCSDGLYNMVSEGLIAELVRMNTMEEAVKILVDLANQNGGTDNITVIIFGQDQPKPVLNHL